MSRTILMLEDDEDDKEVLESILKELNVKNKLIWFNKAEEAYHYLKTTSEQPFVIISDVNIPVENGIEFKRRIDNDPYLRQKSIPFVFYSTSAKEKTVTEAYSVLTVQGFFKKGNSHEEIKRHIKLIVDYWQVCRHPNSKD